MSLEPEWLIKLKDLFKGKDGPRNIAYCVFFVIYLLVGIFIYLAHTIL